jgi:hypothetical protein
MSASTTSTTPAATTTSTATATTATGREGSFRTYYRTNNRGGYQRRGGFQRRFNGNGTTAHAPVAADGSRPRYNRPARTNTTSEEKKQYPTEPNFAVTRNGALALYNVMRRPIVFYANQWEGIRTMIDNGALTTALNENVDKLRRPKSEEEAGSSAAAADEQ